MIACILFFGIWAILGLCFCGIVDPKYTENVSPRKALFGVFIAGPVVWAYAIYRWL